MGRGGRKSRGRSRALERQFWDNSTDATINRAKAAVELERSKRQSKLVRETLLPSSGFESGSWAKQIILRALEHYQNDPRPLVGPKRIAMAIEAAKSELRDSLNELPHGQRLGAYKAANAAAHWVRWALSQPFDSVKEAQAKTED